MTTDNLQLATVWKEEVGKHSSVGSSRTSPTYVNHHMGCIVNTDVFRLKSYKQPSEICPANDIFLSTTMIKRGHLPPAVCNVKGINLYSYMSANCMSVFKCRV